MKKIYIKILVKLSITLAFQLVSISLFAQAPQKMTYQAVVRNSSNSLVANKPVGMQVSILQGSANGTEVYKELFNPNPQTNANGLVTIEIGGGIPVKGTFVGIDWSKGPYFIKTETDPTGGTSYTITGTSQLLSVPYALYAKTAENGFSGNYNDLKNKPTIFDGQYSSLKGAPALSAVATSGSYSDLSNKPVLDGSETKVTAGVNITVTGTGTTESPYIIKTYAHYIGEDYGGGIVFYVYDNGQHGLIAAKKDQAAMGFAVKWSSYGTTYAWQDGINAGKINTIKMISKFGSLIDAANYCVEYYGGGFCDWYLPSLTELGLLYDQKNVVGGFADFNYWSSTEDRSDSDNKAFFMFFPNKFIGSGDKKNPVCVRAIRSF